MWLNTQNGEGYTFSHKKNKIKLLEKSINDQIYVLKSFNSVKLRLNINYLN